MGATILNDARVGDECVIAAGTLIPEGMEVPPRSLVMGLPGKVRRPITEEEREGLRRYAANYFDYKETYLSERDQGGKV
jgi:carbonic anhydrase/acetyltransferase-like protein (isoleucine patch superfamily)